MLVSRTGLSPVMVGRGIELARLERLGPSEEQVLVFNLTAESEYLADHPEAPIESADRALALAQEIGASDVRGAILVNKGSALLELPDRWEEGVALLEQALREAEEAETQGDWLAVLRTCNNLTVTMEMVWPVERVRDLVNRMAATAERSGWYDWLGYVEDVRAAILVEADGDLIAAREILERQHRTEGAAAGPLAQVAQGRGGGTAAATPRRVGGGGAGGAHAPRARGRGAADRRAQQQRAGQAPVHLAQDRLGARLQHPHQAGDVVAGGDRGLGRPRGAGALVSAVTGGWGEAAGQPLSELLEGGTDHVLLEQQGLGELQQQGAPVEDDELASLERPRQISRGFRVHPR